MDVPKAATRSACDRCRSKRVRCPRAAKSTAPCARCIHVGAQCVTGSPGYPGRPRKARLVEGSVTRAPGMASDSVSTPVSPPGYGPTPRDSDSVELYTPESGGPMSANMPTEWFDTGTTSLNLLDDLEGARLELSNPPPHEGLLSAADNLDIMYTGQSSTEMFDFDSFLAPSTCLLDPSPIPCLSEASSLMRFQEKMEQRVSTMGAFFSDPRNVVEGCKEDDFMVMATENPVSVVLMCTKEFIDIIQNLTTAARPAASGSLAHSQLVTSNGAPRIAQTESLSTETALLVLSSYLMLMRLYDSLFHGVSRCFCQQPPEAIKSMKVKAVFRIGGISSLQDMPVKAYAMGIIDVIQCQIRTLEHSLGLPAAYCLSDEANASQPTSGIFSQEDRAQLFQAVMAQEDVKSSRGGKSYVESIRENIKNSVAFFDD
ncbi:hypothetical protein EKO27_g630 [Xylaria grammica]|uniref:Zn(2)-C6 fungal-type domain-containing protein n=1 Tax=Xylaria grammica TaxID=363999 RepID=A0A439DJ66_9PEZI|nr:hypothetical protein EKO27_g630 [Xylaria grammica]